MTEHDQAREEKGRGSKIRNDIFGFVVILVYLFVLATLGIITYGNYGHAHRYHGVSRIRSDQRSMATALASYYVDNGAYPLATIVALDNMMVRNVCSSPADRAVTRFPVTIPVAHGGGSPSVISRTRTSFAIAGIDPASGLAEFSSLTTPISYITSYFSDPSSRSGKETFAYFPDRSGFLLAAYGPDRDEGRSVAATNSMGSMIRVMRQQFLSDLETPFSGNDLAGSRRRLLFGVDPHSGEAFQYDPTNGTTSAGDLYRLSD